MLTGLEYIPYFAFSVDVPLNLRLILFVLQLNESEIEVVNGNPFHYSQEVIIRRALMYQTWTNIY